MWRRRRIGLEMIREEVLEMRKAVNSRHNDEILERSLWQQADGYSVLDGDSYRGRDILY